MDQDETSRLLDQLLELLAAINAEKDPAARELELAECRALVEELQSKAREGS
jgi:hypothetical protein